ncbi:hypothetical protein [Paraurantiacibacter namhicola]|uniref:Uncharacterized protein n=1 Tax=Paraurantiacibacter namhicola TaxID=645517 RepID=A0A1C7D5Q9_9SPHN|nr:hypothetical protein [Paraurantiacibacter namhicola]ANU06692.1 hypothetical protein A6F65_00367 [Paraurantiacibacter namhicola]
MGWLRDKWNSRNWMLVPLILAVPVVAFIYVWLDPYGPPEGSESRPPTFEVFLPDLWPGDPDSEPTRGMDFVASIYGTVIEAPVLRAGMVDARVGRGSTSGTVAEDVARFVRAWPSVTVLDEGVRPEYSTLEMRPEHSATGATLLLREGCLRARKEGWDEEHLVIPFGPIDLFRDAQGYLAVGQPDGAAEYQLRIGEPGGLVWLSPVDDAQLEGVAAFREACGDAPIALMTGTPKRLPDCSAAFLAIEAEKQRHYDAAYAAQKDEAEACRAANESRAAVESKRVGPRTPPAPCPPLLNTPPPIEAIGGDVCRHPDAPVTPGPKPQMPPPPPPGLSESTIVR